MNFFAIIIRIKSFNELRRERLYKDAEFTLEKGEHMGVVGQNGVGKSTLIKIITGSELPLSGDVKWQKNIKIGYLDQYADVEGDLTMIDFLRTAFADLYKTSDQLNELYNQYAKTADDKLLERAGQYQDILDSSNFYNIDTRIEQTITGLGLDNIGRDHLVGKMLVVSVRKLFWPRCCWLTLTLFC